MLIMAALPFAVITWWSVITPLLAILVIAIGWPALARPRLVRLPVTAGYLSDADHPSS